jgi:hypothetical protein
MRRGLSVLLLCSFTLTACDRLSGVATQKILDAEAIGYACRVSLKAPEDCMKDNEAQSPSSVLEGWKAADQDIHDKVIDPSMGKAPPAVVTPASGVPASGVAASGVTPVGANPVGPAPGSALPKAATKAATNKPGKTETVKKAN